MAKQSVKDLEERLDQAIELAFPASDPIAVGSPTGTEGEGDPARSERVPRKVADYWAELAQEAHTSVSDADEQGRETNRGSQALPLIWPALFIEPMLFVSRRINAAVQLSA